MSRRHILVIGALSEDEIHLTKKVGAAYETTEIISRHRELGGRGGITSISTYRASHGKPAAGTIGTNEPNEDPVDVHLIAGVADEERLKSFKAKLQKNGILDLGVVILPSLEEGKDVTQDYLISTMEIETGKTQMMVHFGTANQWPVSRFEDIRSICGDMIPDLVIITMELKTRVVEQIIDAFDSAQVDILLLASPGEPILTDCYSKITHLVCNEADAARMLGYKLEEIKRETWPEICEAFRQRNVKNVVLKLGALGAYYKNATGEGYAPGYAKIDDIVDITGATNAFVGPYAAKFVKDKNSWDLKSATELGNKASALFAGELGYESIPWLEDIENAALEEVLEIKSRARPKRKKAALGDFPPKEA